jgi:transposase
MVRLNGAAHALLHQSLVLVIQDISWKAQVRLWKRYRRLVARGKHSNVVTVAIARALVGFLWAIAKEVPIAPEDQDGS